MKELMIKVCGMKNPGNIAEVAGLLPDYMGFILYHGSPRYVSPEIAGRLVKNIPSSIQKVAVTVNEPIEKALKIAQSGSFDIMQLHGAETPEYCSILSAYIRIIKAFPVSRSIPASLSYYQDFCKMFLFDTAGEKFGGSGKSFDHTVLSDYCHDMTFMIGGGISVDDAAEIKSLRSDKLTGVDLNSRFELEPGVKDISLLRCFINKIRNYDIQY